MKKTPTTRKPDPKRIILRIGISAQTWQHPAVKKAAAALIEAIGRA